MNDSAASVNTCPRCQSTLPTNALYCPFCGDAIHAVPAAPSAPVAAPVRGMGESESRERECCRGAVAAAVVILQREGREFDRMDVMRAARVRLGGGLHPYLGAAVDAAMED